MEHSSSVFARIWSNISTAISGKLRVPETERRCVLYGQVTVWWAHVLVSVPQDLRELISSSIISRMMSPIRISFRCLHRLATSLVPKSSLIKWPALASASGLLATTMLCQPKAPSSQWMGSRLAPNVSKCSWNDQRMPISRTGEWVRWDQWPPIWRLFPQLTKQNWFGYDNPPVLLPYLYLCMVVCASCMLSQLCVCANIPQSLSEGLHATIQLPDVYIYLCCVVCMWWVMCMWCDCLPVLLSPDMCLRLPVCFVRLWSTSFYHLCSFPIHGALVSFCTDWNVLCVQCTFFSWFVTIFRTVITFLVCYNLQCLMINHFIEWASKLNWSIVLPLMCTRVQL